MLGQILLSLASVAPTNALHSALKYLNYSNIFTRAFSIMKWWIINLVYGIANATSELMNQMLNLSNFVNQVNGNGQVGKLMRMGQKIALVLMILCLIWVAIKIIVDHHAPQLKNVLVQLFISAFLIMNIGNMTTWLTSQSVGLAHGLLGTTTSKIDKGTSALPFNILKTHVNDLEYLVDTNFSGTNVSSANPTSKAPAKLHWGLNDLSRKQVDQGEVDFTEFLDNGKIKDNSPLEKKDHPYKKGDYDKKPGTHFLYGWLKYTAENTPKENGKGTKWDTADIWNLLGFSIGGYERYTINFLPVLVALIALAVAYLFAGYAIVKSFIDIVIIDILSTVIVATDLDTGQKTKQVINSLFSAILLVSLQAFELAFYQAACTWANSSVKSVWGFAIFMLAATIMLMAGNNKVAEFFNVDTGAQRGLRAAGSALYLGKQAANLGGAVLGAPGRAKNRMSNMADKLNTTGSIQRAARKQAKQGSRQNAINKMAGFDQSGNVIPSNINNSGGGSITTDNLAPLTQTPQALKKSTEAQNKAAQALDEARTGFEGIAGKAAMIFGNGNQDDSVERAQADPAKPNDEDYSEANEEYNPVYDQPVNAYSGTETESQPSSDKGQYSPSTPGASQNRQGASRNTAHRQPQKNDFASWQTRARQYDKYNRLTTDNGYAPVDYNPITKLPYTQEEWAQNLNNVRSNDVPSHNLDGSRFRTSDDSQNDYQESRSNRPDQSVNDYAKDNLDRNRLRDSNKPDQPNSPKPPRARK
ncbi:hypothetical protein JF75_05450 [Lactobacillus kimbladii]|uniref:DUF8208 domain-containing protein n=1 Tax=Lactobacillus kimbladii TaxID=1218506 RepID=A0A0F4LKI1_9LACO|nr:hypothetical protein [Lactobacillus kimbladii]KJY59085.1 hypothetical protein JF75_05450 [Lactobacillus kimbladii]